MDLATALAQAVSAVFKFLNTESSKKYLDELVDVQKKLQDERAKGADRDDGLVKYYHDRITILSQAAVSELERQKKAA